MTAAGKAIPKKVAIFPAIIFEISKEVIKKDDKTKNSGEIEVKLFFDADIKTPPVLMVRVRWITAEFYYNRF